MTGTRRNKGEKSLGIEEDMEGLYHTMAPVLSEKKLIQFIGAARGEGVTSLIREFASVSTRLFGKSVLLLENKESQLKGMNTSVSSKSLEKVVDGTLLLDDFVTQPADSGYFTGDLSTLGPSLSVVFSSSHISSFIQMLKKRFDIILLDAPSLATSSDGIASARQVDGVVLVVEAEKTRWPVAANAQDKIQKAGGNILGVVLNKQRHYIPAAIYKRL